MENKILIRRYTFEGPDNWLEQVLKQSLPDGEQGFCGEGKSIVVETLRNDLWEEEDETTEL